MDKQEFDNKRKNLTTIQKIEFEHFLKSKTDEEIAEIRGVNRSTVNKHITNIATAFGIKRDKLINDSGTDGIEKIVHRQKLLKLCLKHIPDEVTRPHIYEESGDDKSDDAPVSVSESIVNTDDRPQPLTNPQNIPTRESIPELITLEFIGRDRDLTNLANLSRQAKIVLIKAGAGVGKSTLAREFLQTQFKKVIRIEMGLESGNVTPAEEKVSQILRKDFDEEPSRDFGINLGILGEKLADRANPIGVLIDNLEPALDENYRFREKLRGYDALLAVLGDRDVFSFTLLTSRRSLITPRARVHEYSLVGLDITAWRQYFHDCENVVDSEALMQMRDAYNGNAKVMDILHGAIKNRFDGNIGAYWSRYKDALLADSELETLISVEMDWLRDNQSDAYKLLCRMGCYRYQDVKTVPFEGLICLLWDVPDSRQNWIVDYLSKSSLIEFKGEYYLHPAVRESAKLRLLQNRIDWETVNRKAADFWTKNVESVEDVSDALRACEAYNHLYEIEDYRTSGEVICNARKNKWIMKESLGAAFYRLGLLDSLVRIISMLLNNLSDSFLLAKLYNLIGDAQWLKGNIHGAIACHKGSYKNASQTINKKQLKHSDIMHAHLLAMNSYFNTALCQADLLEMGEAKDALEYSIDLANDLSDQYKNTSPCNFDEDVLYYLKRISRFSKPHGHVFFAYVYESVGEREQASSILASYDPSLPCYTSWQKGYDLLFCGQTYLKRQEFDRAIYFFELALNYAYESNYTQVKAKAITGLADIYRQLNDLKASLSNSLEAVDLLKSIKAKPDLAEAYFQLGLTYQAMEEHDQAEEYKAKALELFAQMEAPKQIERVNKAFGGNIQ